MARIITGTFTLEPTFKTLSDWPMKCRSYSSASPSFFLSRVLVVLGLRHLVNSDTLHILVSALSHVGQAPLSRPVSLTAHGTGQTNVPSPSMIWLCSSLCFAPLVLSALLHLPFAPGDDNLWMLNVVGGRMPLGCSSKRLCWRQPRYRETGGLLPLA